MARKDKSKGQDSGNSDNPGRLKQIGLTYKMTRRADRWIGWIISAVGLLTFGLVLGLGFLIGHPVYLGILGFLVALLTTAIVFGRRAERAAFSQMEGQPGAAAAVLENVKRGIAFTPAVAIDRNQNVVHRAVGKCGVVLIGEGNPNRLKQLIASEKRRMNRVVSDVPVHDVIVGRDEGQVELKKLRSTVMKYPKVLSGGPMPKGMRLPKGNVQRRAR
jgi:hypothetical protein